LEIFDNNISVKHDPWLGAHTARICNRVDSDRSWSKLLRNSTHINLLVDLGRSWNIVPEKLKQHMVDDFIIVNMSCDPFRQWEDRIVEQLSQHTDNFIVLSGGINYLQQPKNHVCFLPYLFLWQKYSYTLVETTDQPRRYKLSCMNNIARYHRIENFIKLRKKPYFAELLFHMWYWYDKKTVKQQCPGPFYNKDIIKEFESMLPETVDSMNDDPHSINLPAFNDSYINLVTETSIFEDTIFISEKTWKPFMSGQFGLWLGNPGTVAHLRSCGFDLFDDIFDGHSYDLETNLNQRIDLIHSLIDKSMIMDVEQIWKETLPRRLANIDRFRSKELENYLTSQCNNYQHLV